MFYIITRFFIRIIGKLFFGFRVFNRENIPLAGGVILAGNHTSYFDPPVIAAASPRVANFLARESLFRNAFFAWLIRALHAFPVKTNFGDVRALRWAIKTLRKGQVVTIFPEGGRRVAGKPEEPLAGVGFLAIRANVPIVPVLICGTDKVLPKNSKCINFFSKIKIYFGTAIYPKEINGLSEKQRYANLAKRTMAAISALGDKAEIE